MVGLRNFFCEPFLKCSLSRVIKAHTLSAKNLPISKRLRTFGARNSMKRQKNVIAMRVSSVCFDVLPPCLGYSGGCVFCCRV